MVSGYYKVKDGKIKKELDRISLTSKEARLFVNIKDRHQSMVQVSGDAKNNAYFHDI